MDGGRQRSRLEQLVEKNSDVFSKNSLDYGHTMTVQHEILVDPKHSNSPTVKYHPAGGSRRLS